MQRKLLRLFLKGFSLGAFASLVLCAIDLRVSLIAALMVTLIFLLERKS